MQCSRTSAMHGKYQREWWVMHIWRHFSLIEGHERYTGGMAAKSVREGQ